MHILYLQLRDFHVVSGLRHLLESLFEHCVEKGILVNIIGYKQKTSPIDGAFVSGIDGVETRIFYRSYQNKSSFVYRYLYECWLIIRVALRPKLWRPSSVCLAHAFPSSFLLIWLAKNVFRKKVVFWVQDLWPENAVQVGALARKSLAYRFFFTLEKMAYRKSDIIVPISEDIEQKLLGYGVPQSKLKVIHNWGYNDCSVSIPWEDNKFVSLANLSADVFYAIYAGAIGPPQNVELIVDAASLLIERADIRFIIVGEGLSLNSVKEKAERLDNIAFYPLQPPDTAYHIYSAASVNLITLREGMVFTALPSKTAILLACGKPVIACIDTDSCYAQLLINYGVGPVVNPTDANELASAIVDMADMVRCNRSTRENVLKCFEEQFSRRISLERFTNILSLGAK